MLAVAAQAGYCPVRRGWRVDPGGCPWNE